MISSYCPFILIHLFQIEKSDEEGVDRERREGGLERSHSSSDLRGTPSSLRQPEVALRQHKTRQAIQPSACRQPGVLHTSLAGGSSLLLRSKSRSSWELSRSCEDNNKSSCSSWERNSCEKGSRNSSWEGNSSGESSKSSSPEPESEFLRVFAQLRATRQLAV